MPFRGRAERLEEQVELLRRLWAEPVVTTYTGKFHHIDRAGIKPLPGATIPIWFGGGAERLLQRAARLGDGFISHQPTTRPAGWSPSSGRSWPRRDGGRTSSTSRG